MTPLDSILAGTASPPQWIALSAVVGLALGLAIAGVLVLAAHARRRYDALNRGERPEDLP